MNWWDQAACRGEALSTFFPTPSKRGAAADYYGEARAICAGCPVRTECLDDTIASETCGKRHGFFGGMSPNERDVEFRRRREEGGLIRRAPKFAQCGTTAGYARHLRLDERPCDACRHASNAAASFNRGRDAYTTTTTPLAQMYDISTIASRRDLYEGDDEEDVS